MVHKVVWGLHPNVIIVDRIQAVRVLREELSLCLQQINMKKRLNYSNKGTERKTRSGKNYTHNFWAIKSIPEIYLGLYHRIIKLGPTTL